MQLSKAKITDTLSIKNTHLIILLSGLRKFFHDSKFTLWFASLCLLTFLFTLFVCYAVMVKSKGYSQRFVFAVKETDIKNYWKYGKKITTDGGVFEIRHNQVGAIYKGEAGYLVPISGTKDRLTLTDHPHKNEQIFYRNIFKMEYKRPFDSNDLWAIHYLKDNRHQPVVRPLLVDTSQFDIVLKGPNSLDYSRADFRKNEQYLKIGHDVIFYTRSPNGFEVTSHSGVNFGWLLDYDGQLYRARIPPIGDGTKKSVEQIELQKIVRNTAGSSKTITEIDSITSGWQGLAVVTATQDSIIFLSANGKEPRMAYITVRVPYGEHPQCEFNMEVTFHNITTRNWEPVVGPDLSTTKKGAWNEGAGYYFDEKTAKSYLLFTDAYSGRLFIQEQTPNGLGSSLKYDVLDENKEPAYLEGVTVDQDGSIFIFDRGGVVYYTLSLNFSKLPSSISWNRYQLDSIEHGQDPAMDPSMNYIWISTENFIQRIDKSLFTGYYRFAEACNKLKEPGFLGCFFLLVLTVWARINRIHANEKDKINKQLYEANNEKDQINIQLAQTNEEKDKINKQLVEASEVYEGAVKKLGNYAKENDEIKKQLDEADRLYRDAKRKLGRYTKQPLMPPLDDGMGEIVGGSSEKMKKVFDLIRKYADLPCHVLITGESGTGKELVANEIYKQSSRNKKLFIIRDLNTINPQLFESELFGYKKGAFTGADHDKEGLLEAADGGTLFLDEIGSLELYLQKKLLRAVESMEITRIGENLPRKINVRFIFATNENLEELVVVGKFRKDLLSRIEIAKIDLPPLRERKEDIAALDGGAKKIRYFVISVKSDGNIHWMFPLSAA